MAERHLLADLGGTNTRVALADNAGLLPGTTRHYRNTDFPGVLPLLAHYLEETGPGPVTALCAGVAGPVQNGTARLTNYDWHIDGAALRGATGAGAVHLINDLQAQGYALDDLPGDVMTRLFPGVRAPTGAARLVLNLGTGCNAAAVHRVGDALFVPAAESGHSALPHATGRMGALFDHLRDSHPHLPVEAALSGPGLANIHEWASGTRASPTEIIAAAETGEAAACDTLTLFTQVLGTVAGCFALHHMALGGIYLTGGIARATAPYISQSGFHARFTDRGPYTDIVRSIPVSVIDDDSFPLLGCARYLRQALKEQAF